MKALPAAPRAFTSLVALVACGGAAPPPTPPTSDVQLEAPSAEPRPDADLLERGWGRGPRPWSPCAPSDVFVFCVRPIKPRVGADDAVERLDLGGGDARWFEPDTFGPNDDGSLRLLADGGDVYAVTSRQITTLPRDASRPTTLQTFGPLARGAWIAQQQIVDGFLWELLSVGTIDEPRQLVRATKLGESSPRVSLDLRGLAPAGRTFFVGPEARAWVGVGPPRSLVMWRGAKIGQPEPADLQGLELSDAGAPRNLVHVAFRGREVIVLEQTADGYRVRIVGPDGGEPRLVFETQDDERELPTHEEIPNVVADATHLYFLDPDWARSNGVRVVRLPLDGAPGLATPEPLGVIGEPGLLWLQRGVLHVMGTVSGDILRLHRSASR